MTVSSHIDYMTLALQHAARGRLTVSPNPMVGCVIVKNDQVVGVGHHQRAGEPHAEVYALRDAGDAAKEATAYVTLEPCCHVGRTPPCTQALIQAGIKKVYVACLDPNPLVAGKGITELQAAGMEVEVGLCEEAATQLNEIFFYFMKHKRPFVIAKWAMSLDGKTITHAQDSRQISSSESQQHTHELRSQVDAILIGANTARLDNPQLTAREIDNAKQPIRIVLSTNGDLPKELNLFAASMPSKTIVATCASAIDINAEIITLAKNEKQKVHLPSLLDELGKRNITSLLIEGGMTVHQQFFAENLVNKIQVYLAPVVIGSGEKKQYFLNMNANQLGHDFNFTVNVEHKNV